MELDEIQMLLEQGLPGCQVEVAGDSNSISLQVVGKVFEGLNKVKRQQKVYGFLKELISKGEIHAVNMQTLTPEEFEK
jgi:acid stress-induced BolA-like protein IbaG/YrbA